MASSVIVNSSSDLNSGATLDFVETTNYYPYDTRAEVPESWRPCLHPCFDVYYFNLGLRLLTTEDIRRPELRALLLEIRNDCFEELADNSDFQKLPIDWVMTISDCNLTERTALVGIHSRSQAKSYRWSKPDLVECSKEVFWAYIADYPAHERSIPLLLENEFVRALINAEQKTREGRSFPLDGPQIEAVQRRYNFLKANQLNGNYKATAVICWLMGAVMPLDELESGAEFVHMSNKIFRALAKGLI